MVAGVTERAVRLDPSLDEAQITLAMSRLDSIWGQLFPAEQQRIVRLLIEKVIVSPNDLEVRFRPNGIELPARVWFKEGRADLSVRVIGVVSDQYDRVITLLILPDRDPREGRAHNEEDVPLVGTFANFIRNG